MRQTLHHRNKAACRKMDQDVWQGYLENGERAFAGLYEAFFDRLFLYGCSIVQDEAFVKDAIQEVFLNLLQRERTELNIENISSYLFVALRNYLRKTLYNEAKKRRHQELYMEEKELIECPELDIQLLGEIDRPDLLKMEINRLPDRQREILFLRFFEGLDYKEISEILSISHQVVRNYAYRAMKKLRSNMEGAYPLFRSISAALLLLIAKFPYF